MTEWNYERTKTAAIIEELIEMVEPFKKKIANQLKNQKVYIHCQHCNKGYEEISRGVDDFGDLYFTVIRNCPCDGNQNEYKGDE